MIFYVTIIDIDKASIVVHVSVIPFSQSLENGSSRSISILLTHCFMKNVVGNSSRLSHMKILWLKVTESLKAITA